MNRGYVYNDMRLASKAERDFRKALALNPQYGEAHLGLAYALLQLRHSTAALKEAEAATRLLPESESLHLVKAEAYRQRTMLAPAEAEYRAALQTESECGDHLLGARRHPVSRPQIFRLSGHAEHRPLGRAQRPHDLGPTRQGLRAPGPFVGGPPGDRSSRALRW